jgi:hypothetical protein
MVGLRAVSTPPRWQLRGDGAVLYTALVIVARPSYMSWCTTKGEREASLPGDRQDRGA